MQGLDPTSNVFYGAIDRYVRQEPDDYDICPTYGEDLDDCECDEDEDRDDIDEDIPE